MNRKNGFEGCEKTNGFFRRDQPSLTSCKKQIIIFVMYARFQSTILNKLRFAIIINQA
jgi:hypothetical protein